MEITASDLIKNAVFDQVSNLSNPRAAEKEKEKGVAGYFTGYQAALAEMQAALSNLNSPVSRVATRVASNIEGLKGAIEKLEGEYGDLKKSYDELNAKYEGASCLLLEYEEGKGK